jgi:hypothetical protein
MRSAAVARGMFRAAAPRCTPKGVPLLHRPQCPRVSRSASRSPVPGFWSVGLAGVGRVPYKLCCSAL